MSEFIEGEVIVLPSITIRITDPDCGHTYEWLRTKPLPNHCPSCDEPTTGPYGTCEDFPCCGHQLGECGYSPTHSSDYWSEWMDRREEAGYDRDDPDFYPEWE